jgi:hypothetical protein
MQGYKFTMLSFEHAGRLKTRFKGSTRWFRALLSKPTIPYLRRHFTN